MPTQQFVQPRNLSRSPFPITAAWEGPREPWYDHYPDGVPPRLEYPPLRAEQLLLCTEERFASRTALWYYRTSWTYRDLVARVRQVAANLRKLGVQPGDRVLMVLPNCPEFVVAWFALHWLGAEIVHGSPLLAGSDLTRLARAARIRAVIGLDFRLAPVLEMARLYPVPLLFVASLAPHLPVGMRWPYRLKSWLQGSLHTLPYTDVYGFDGLYRPTAVPLCEPLLTEADLPAVLQPTGGTTGTPKIAVLTHKNLQANVAQLHVWSGLEAGAETVLAVLPFFHVFGSTVGLLSSVAGGSTLLLQANFNAARVWKVMQQFQPGVAPMVPFMFASLCEEMGRRGKDITGLKYCFSGASPLAADVKVEFQRRTGATIFEGFGLSEASPVTHANPPDRTAQSGSIGLPLPNTSARIVDSETGTQLLPPGEVGELIIRGPQVMAGYLDDPAETAQVLRDGWLFTGDLARMDANGFFTIVDRKKDMIISAGLNVFPAEVEEVLAAHPDIEECAVVGTPDKFYGERIVAYVVPKPGRHVTPAALEAHCRTALASYKVPRIITVCSALPKNFLGKVRRVELRSRAA